MPDGTTAAYQYDHAGRRIQETLNSTQTTNFLWDELSPYGDVIAEYDDSPTPQLLAEYHLANGQLLSQTRGTATHFYLQDGQHSVRAMADTSGIITDTYDYTAFGEIYASTGTTDNPYRFAGQQFDDETDLYSMRARYYDPSDGRFLTRDTYAYNYQNPVELNRYGYAANNPINGYDPTGMMVATSFLYRNSLIPASALALVGKIEVGIYLIILAAMIIHLADLIDEYLDKHNPPVITFPPQLFTPPAWTPPSIPPFIPPTLPPIDLPPFDLPDMDDIFDIPPFDLPDPGDTFNVPPFDLPDLDNIIDLPPFEWPQLEWPPIFPFADNQDPNDPYWIARNGGTNSKWYNYHKNMPDNTLKSVMRKLSRNIEEHTSYLNDPTSHVPEWATLRPEHQQNLLKHWSEEIARYKDEIAIIEGIFREERSGE